MATPMSTQHKPSGSHNRGTPPPRPTTPLRPPSRSSIRSSNSPTRAGFTTSDNPLGNLESAFGEFSDSMADLEANFVHLQLMHESLVRFNECFASFLYGLNVNAFCVDFPEAPVSESFRRAKDNPRFLHGPFAYGGDTELAFGKSTGTEAGQDGDHTFLTTDTSFVDNPPNSTSMKPQTKNVNNGSISGGKSPTLSTTRGGRAASAAVGIGRGTNNVSRGRPSGLARASARGRVASGRRP